MSNNQLIRVADVMTQEFDIVEGVATVATALRNAKYLDNECILVNRRHNNDEYGILMLSDIARRVLAKDRAADRTNVYEVMSKPCVSVHPEMDIRYCARLFDQLGFGHAPVVKDREILGLISYKRIVLEGFLQTLE